MKIYLFMFQVKVEDGKVYVTVNKSVSTGKAGELKIQKQNKTPRCAFPGCVLNLLFVS